MTPRIVIPCAPDGAPYRHHRWARRIVYGNPDRPVWDRWCERCGQWWIDVIEHKA